MNIIKQRFLHIAIRILLCLTTGALTLLLAATWSPPAFSASGIVLNSSVQVAFPTAMTFKIHAESDTNITSLRLHYTVNRQNVANVISEGWAQFDPAPSVDTQWLWDMRKSSLAPGAEVNYWWTAEDVAGRSSETIPSTVSFDDDRYRWQSKTEDPIILSWYNGSTDFADALLAAGQEGFKKIENDTGAIPRGQVRIYIYASAEDMQSSHLFAQQWEGGANFIGFNIIAIGVPPAEIEYGKVTVAHELAHWIINQITFNNYGAGLPTWLNEGLATYAEGTSSTNYSTYHDALDFAIKNNLLLSVRSLSSPFSAIPQTAIISYGESNSIVTFLIQKYGREKMVQLLDVFHEGSSYDDALKQVYGFDQDGLDSWWRQSLIAVPSQVQLEAKER